MGRSPGGHILPASLEHAALNQGVAVDEEQIHDAGTVRPVTPSRSLIPLLLPESRRAGRRARARAKVPSLRAKMPAQTTTEEAVPEAALGSGVPALLDLEVVDRPRDLGAASGPYSRTSTPRAAMGASSRAL